MELRTGSGRIVRDRGGEAVAPLAALTGTPMALVGRSETSVSPLGPRTSGGLCIGNPEAPSAGVSLGEGAEPPSGSAGSAGAPNLDTYGTRLGAPAEPALPE